MNPNVYQYKAIQSSIYPPNQCMVYPVLGLTGEAGEVADKIKKILRSGRVLPTGITRQEKVDIAKELGDVLWYLAVLSDELGYDLSEIMEMNIEKLESRAQRGVLEGNGDNR